MVVKVEVGISSLHPQDNVFLSLQGVTVTRLIIPITILNKLHLGRHKSLTLILLRNGISYWNRFAAILCTTHDMSLPLNIPLLEAGKLEISIGEIAPV